MTVIIAYGIPAPQGSKSFKGFNRKGRAILAESSRKVKPWRMQVWMAACEACAGKTLQGPVRVRMVFSMPRTLRTPKRKRTFPDRKPDIDKLCRSTLDALVFAKAMKDDAQVVDMSAKKVYVGDVCGLSAPGAHITIEALAQQ